VLILALLGGFLSSPENAAPDQKIAMTAAIKIEVVFMMWLFAYGCT